MMRPITAMIVMKMLGPLPRASAYSCTNGCGASSAKNVFKSGMQNRKRIVVMKPSTPVAIALVMMPRPATTLFVWLHQDGGTTGVQ